MPYGTKPVAAQRRPPQDPLAGKFKQKSSFKAGTATDSVESHDVDDFDRMGRSGRPHVEEGSNPVSVIARYATLGRALKTNESFAKVAQQIAQIAEMAEQTVMQEAGDWFDQHTIKRNMKEMKNYAAQFGKIAEELDTLQQRATALYDDMGNVLTRYFELNDGDDQGSVPGHEPEKTAVDRSAQGMGNQGQQGWTEQEKGGFKYDEPGKMSTGGYKVQDEPDEEDEAVDPTGDEFYTPGKGPHDEEDMDEDSPATPRDVAASAGKYTPGMSKCPTCKGQQRVYRAGHYVPCSTCQGTGVVKEDSPAEQGNRAGKMDAVIGRLSDAQLQKELVRRENEPSEGNMWLTQLRAAAQQRGLKAEGQQQVSEDDVADELARRGLSWEEVMRLLHQQGGGKSLAQESRGDSAAMARNTAYRPNRIKRPTKEGRGFSTPGAQSARDNFKTTGIPGEETDEARGDLSNLGAQKQQPFSASNQPTREERLIVAKEFAQHPAALNRVVKTFNRNEVKDVLKSGRARTVKEARTLLAKEAIAKFAARAKELLERSTDDEEQETRTNVTEAVTPEQKLAQLQQIVSQHQFGKVDGQKIDAFSAGAILAVYKALNPENRAKYIQLPVLKMARLAFKLVK